MKVLVFDDSKLNTFFLKESLEKVSVEVEELKDLSQITQDISLILIDWLIPDSWLSFREEIVLEAQLNNVPVVVWTACQCVDDEVRKKFPGVSVVEKDTWGIEVLKELQKLRSLEISK
jgi:DNA-binding response OmpR family regulator